MKPSRLNPLLNVYSSFRPHHRNAPPVSLYSTTTTTTTETPQRHLHSRISDITNPKAPIYPILDQWVQYGRPVDKPGFLSVINELKNSKRFDHALQVSMWMTERWWFELSPAEAALRLKLIAKVDGVEKAERFLDNIPVELKSIESYSALLNCYADANLVEKAEGTMQRIRDSGLAVTSLPYNDLLQLYCQTGRRDKFKALVKEMEEKRVQCDKFTYRILFNAYAVDFDYEAVENIVAQWESCIDCSLDRTGYAVVGNVYIEAGKEDKAVEMLNKCEELIPTNSKSRRRETYKHLVLQYAALGKKDDVVRLWKLYENQMKVDNKGCRIMITSLLKSAESENAEKIFRKWESQKSVFDIPNHLVASRKDLLHKAKAIIKRIILKGVQPDAKSQGKKAGAKSSEKIADAKSLGEKADPKSSEKKAGAESSEKIADPKLLYSMAKVHLDRDQTQKAVELTRKALIAMQPGSGLKTKKDILVACLKYLIKKPDPEGAKQYIKLLSDKNLITVITRDRLLSKISMGDSNSVAAGRGSSRNVTENEGKGRSSKVNRIKVASNPVTKSKGRSSNIAESEQKARSSKVKIIKADSNSVSPGHVSLNSPVAPKGLEPAAKSLGKKAGTKSSEIIADAKSSKRKDDAKSLYSMAKVHLDRDQTQKAVELTRKALIAMQPGSGVKTNNDILAACLKYLIKKPDPEGAKQYIKLLSGKNLITVITRDRLLSKISKGDSNFVAASKGRARDVIKNEGQGRSSKVRISKVDSNFVTTGKMRLSNIFKSSKRKTASKSDM